MAKNKQINLGEMAIAIALNTKAIQDGLNEVKVHLKKGSSDIQKHAKDYDKLAIVAGYAFTKVVGAVKSGVDAFNDYKNAMTGLKSISEGTGNSFGQAQKFIEEFTSDGLVPASNAATALKNLLSRGFGMDEAADIMSRFKDSAAFGRQSALSLGEAIRSATEGLKNENSILVDNAGVTKNVSKMWDEYAQTIGKSVNDLTLAEKRQAEYNGILKETQHQVGDAAKYAKEFSGAQAKSAAESLKLKQALGSSLVPVLNTLLNVITPIISFITEIINQNPILSASFISMIATITGLTTAAFTLVSALRLLKPAIEAITLSMSKHPVMLAFAIALTAIVGIISAISAESQRAAKAQESYNKAIEEHNKLVNEGINKSQVAKVQDEINELKRLSAEYEQAKIKYLEYQAAVQEKSNKSPSANLDYLIMDMNEYADVMERAKAGLKEYGATEENVSRIIREKEEAIKGANRVTSEQYNNDARSLAQRRNTILETQALINSYKTAAKGTSEWVNAQQKLAEMFPQYSSNSGIAINAIESLTAVQEASVKAEFILLQQKARVQRQDLENTISVEEAKVSAIRTTIDAMNLEQGEISKAALDAYKKLNTAMKNLETLKADAKALKDFENIDIDEVTGVDPSKTYSSTISSYENKAYNNALKLLEHKKHLNQLSLEDEVKTLEQIQKMHVKTADERMEIEERLYDARKAIADRNRELDENALKRKTQDTLDMLEDKKNEGALTLEQETQAYNEIIKIHKEYLQRILNDERITSDEKMRIQQEETDSIREFEKKKYDIKKEYEEKDRQDTVNSIDRMNSAIISALRNRYQQQQELQEQALQNELDALDDWRDRSLDNINDVYDTRIKAIDDAAKAQQKALQDEIDALSQGKKEKDRTEQDALELAKIQRIRDKIDYEHNEFNKAQLQKELNKLLEEREKRLYEQQLEDKKASLEEQIDAIKENADKQKELLEQQKEAEIERIKYLYDVRKATLVQELEDVKQFYSEKLTQAQLQAEAEKMIMDNNQKEILALLQSYGDEYAITGKTLGDRLYDGFKPAIDNIKALISSITESINAAREEALRVQVEASKIVIPVVPAANTGTNTAADAKKIEVNQQLVFNSPNLTPSETARKNKQASRELAMEWELS